MSASLGLRRSLTGLALLDAVACRVAATGRALEPPPRPPREPSLAQKKAHIMELARRFGWRGKTYHSAIKFARSVRNEQLQREVRDVG